MNTYVPVAYWIHFPATVPVKAEAEEHHYAWRDTLRRHAFRVIEEPIELPRRRA